ncbi:MAG: hypothetical protein H6658_20475 [Ardenticatenaceae bacterium]|nr:hypothetical protein [Ardenticatenaceae bacterium]
MIHSKWLFTFILALGLTGCFAVNPPERISEMRYPVGPYEVVETIDKEDGFPDYVFERVIVVQDGRSTTTIGTYRDESEAGITVLPALVEGWLVIYSSSHLFLWRPDEEVRHFDVYEAAGWLEYAERFQPGLNGHYDYRAAGFWVENGRWFIEYECTYCQANTPASLLFSSDNAGETYMLEK